MFFKMVTTHIGVRPSGEFHLGNLLAVSYAINLIKNQNDQKNRFILTINDWDGNNDFKQSMEFGTPLIYRGSFEENKNNLELFTNYIKEICSYEGINYEAINTSSLFQKNKGKELLKKICENSNLVSSVIGYKNQSIPIFPLDEEIKRYVSFAVYDGQVIRAKSFDDSEIIHHLGSKKMIEMPIEIKLAVKHSILDSSANYFVLGKNYTLPTIEKIKKISQILGHSRDYHRSPLLLHHGKVMSKSRRNTISLNGLLEKKSSLEIHSRLSGLINCLGDRSYINAMELNI